MTIEDSSTLSMLIAAYQESVIYESAVPSAFRLAKLFPTMKYSNGGLVLLGVRRDGSVLGIPDEALDLVYSRFERLCGELTVARVEMGTLRVGEKLVVFLVFNPIAKHLAPLDRYCDDISRVEMV